MNSLEHKPAASRNLVFSISIGFVIFLGAVLRLYDLGTESYWFDELYTVHMAQESLGQLLAVHALNFPPVYYALIHYWVQLLGTSETATRLLSAIFGIISMVFTYLVGSRLFGKYVGLVGTFIMAISEFQIYYSQETRFYSLFLLMTLLSFFFFIEALRTGRSGYFLLYALASIVLVYSHAFGIFVIAGQGLFLLLRWNRYRDVRAKWLLCQGAFLLAIGPSFLASILDKTHTPELGASGVNWIPMPSVTAPFATVYKYVFPLRYDRSLRSIALNFAAGILFFLLAVSAFALRRGAARWFAALKKTMSGKQLLASKGEELLLVGCWFLCPILFPLVLSKLVAPLYLDRYTMSAAPAFYFLLAYGIVKVRKVIPPLIVLLTLVILIAPGLQYYYVADVKEQWRQAASYIDANAVKGDELVFAPDEGGWQHVSFEWYDRGGFQTCGLTMAEINDVTQTSGALEQCISGRTRFWVIMRGTADAVDRFQSFFLSSERSDLSLIGQHMFTGIYVYLFEIKR